MLLIAPKNIWKTQYCLCLFLEIMTQLIKVIHRFIIVSGFILEPFSFY